MKLLFILGEIIIFFGGNYYKFWGKMLFILGKIIIYFGS